jgi:hypothetical protein
MTIVLDSPVSVVDALRGDRTVRPLLNHASASGLRAQLEDGIYDVLGALRLDHPIVSVHRRTVGFAVSSLIRRCD